MKTSPASANEFESLLDALASEIVLASWYFNLRKDLMAARPHYTKVFKESKTFWSLTLHSLLDAALIRLCRIYDQHPKSLSLRGLLCRIEANPNIFDIENFRERLKDNPFVESLSQTAETLDINTLNQDIQYACAANLLVKRLVIWRNNITAHRTAKNVITQTNIAGKYPFSEGDVSELLKRAEKILNRYSILFRASLYETQPFGHDDYLYILKTLRQHQEEIASERARLRQANSTQRSGVS